MIREKDLEESELEHLVCSIQEALEPWAPALVVNGAPGIAKRRGLFGVHLPQGRSLSEARERVGGSAVVGVSAHSIRECRAAEDGGADYVTLSPVFVSTSKGRHLPPLGLDTLRAATSGLKIPVLALGGVTAATAEACRHAGASGVAVLGPVMAAADAGAAVRSILDAWGRG